MFGNSLLHARVSTFTCIRKGDLVLIPGGGNGEILRFLPECRVIFSDPSRVMLNLAQKVPTQAHVQFEEGSLNDLPRFPKANHILLHFLLDLFPPEELELVMEHLHRQLLPEGKLHITDFSLENITCSQTGFRLLTHAMIGFFRLTTGLQIRKLPAIQSCSGLQKFKRKSIHTRSCGYIFSGIWYKLYTP